MSKSKLKMKKPGQSARLLNGTLVFSTEALEDGTVEQYGRNWELYCTWCDLNDLDPIPSTPTMIFAYVCWLAERKARILITVRTC